MMFHIHPDATDSAFNHAWGWCRTCGKVLRITDIKYFRNEQGPACSFECVENVALMYWTADGL